jgi:hypothetical protein
MILICKIIYILLSLFLTNKVLSEAKESEQLPVAFLLIAGFSGFYIMIFTLLI